MDGEQYNKLEMCSVLEALNTGVYSKQCGKAVAEMIRLKYVPCKKSAIYNLLKKRREGKAIINTDWISTGRPPLLDSKSMDAIVEKIKEHQGRAVGADDLSKMIVLQRKEMVAQAGSLPLVSPMSSRQLPS
jgi:transposase